MFNYAIIYNSQERKSRWSSKRSQYLPVWFNCSLSLSLSLSLYIYKPETCIRVRITSLERRHRHRRSHRKSSQATIKARSFAHCQNQRRNTRIIGRFDALACLHAAVRSGWQYTLCGADKDVFCPRCIHVIGFKVSEEDRTALTKLLCVVGGLLPYLAAGRQTG